MKFQVTRAFSITVKGRRTEYKVGQRIGEAAYNRLTKSQQRNYFLSARAAAAKTPYTRQELESIVSLYVAHAGDREAMVADFIAANPGSQHTAASVRQVGSQLRAMDVQHPGDNDWTVKSLVSEVAMEFDSERFTLASFDENLDALLADIRA